MKKVKEMKKVNEMKEMNVCLTALLLCFFLAV